MALANMGVRLYESASTKARDWMEPLMKLNTVYDGSRPRFSALHEYSPN